MFKKSVVWLISLYQAVKPLRFGSTCRFTPSCSQYTKTAVIKYGTAGGLLMGLKRVLRCHPFSSGGPDPVP